MTVDLTNPTFHNEDAARAQVEAIRRLEGACCPCCGSADAVSSRL